MIIIKKHKEAFKSLSKLLILQVSIGVIGFVNILLIGKHLSPEEYSSFALMLSAYYAFAVFVSPIRNVINKEMPSLFVRGELSKIKYVYVKATKYLFILMIITAFVLAIGTSRIMEMFKMQDPRMVISISAMIFINMFLDIFKSMSNAKRDYNQYSGIFYMEAGIRLSMTLVFISTFIDPFRATLSYIVGSFCALLWVIYLNRWFFSTRTYHPTRRLNWSWLIPVVLSTLFYIGFNAGDMILVKNILSPEDAGFYGAATQLSKMFMVIGAAFTVYMFPITASAIKTGAPIVKRILLTILVFFGLAMLGWILLALFNGTFITLFFNKAYLSAGKLSVVLSLAMIMLCITQLMVQLFLVLEAKWILTILIALVIFDYSLIYMRGVDSYSIACIHTMFIFFAMIVSFGSLFYLKRKEVVC